MFGERFPVVLTFDFDAESLWLARDPDSADKPVWLSQGTYGAKEGLRRVLATLEAFDIRCTFFVPGRTIDGHPDEVRRIVEAGHEIGHHSYSHQWLDATTPEAEERAEWDRGLEAIVRTSGVAPTGYRSPAGEFSPRTLDLMLEYGMRYSSNMFDADAPYLLARPGGEATRIVELPFAWALDDAPFFLYSNKLPGRVMSAPSAVLETWTLEFDGLVREPGKYMLLAMHPQIIGRPSRIWLLERFLEHARAETRTWFARCDEVAETARAVLAPSHAGG